MNGKKSRSGLEGGSLGLFPTIITLMPVVSGKILWTILYHEKL